MGKRRFDTPFLRTFPVLLLLNLVWAAGEVVGYLTGRAAPTVRPAVAALPATAAEETAVAPAAQVAHGR